MICTRSLSTPKSCCPWLLTLLFVLLSAATLPAQAGTVPDTPLNPSISYPASTTVQVRWNDNSVNETSFTIERKLDTDPSTAWAPVGSTDATDIGGRGAGLSFADSNDFAFDTVYDYRVKAVAADGTASAPTAAVVATTAPVKPISLAVSAVANSDSKLTLTFTDNARHTGYFGIFRKGPGQTTFQNIRNIGLSPGKGNLETYTDTGLVANTTYSYLVYASNNAGASDPSDAVTATTNTAQSVPSAPTVNVYAGTSGADGQADPKTTLRIDLTDNGTNSTSLTLQFKNADDPSSVFTTLVGYPKSVIAGGGSLFREYRTGLAVDTGYVFQAYASNSRGNSAIATSNTVYTVPVKPISAQATALSDTTIRLTFVDNARHTGYFGIFRKGPGQTTFQNIRNIGLSPGKGNLETYTDTGLVANTTYSYFVVAGNNSGASDPSDTVTATTFPTNPPGAPTSLQAQGAANPTQINLSWLDNSTDESGFVVEREAEGETAFTALLGANTGDPTVGPQPGTGRVFYSDKTVADDTTYTYRVKATNPAGSSVATSAITATTVPTAPFALSPQLNGQVSVTLTWTDKSKHEDGFFVYRRGPDDSRPVKIGSAPAATGVGGNATFTDGSLAANSTYTYTVTAYNSAGESAATNAVTISTTVLTPTITSLDPPALVAGSAPDLFVNGTNFIQNVTTATINGEATSIAGFATTRLQLRVPDDIITKPGTYTVALTNGGTAATATLTITTPAANPKPVITSLDSSVFQINSAPNLFVNGSGFLQPGTTATVNGEAASIAGFTATRLQIRLPDDVISKAGAYTLTLTNPAAPYGGGGGGTATAAFTVVAPPTVTITAPANGTTYTAPASVTVAASATPAPGSGSTITGYTLFVNGVSQGSSASGTFALTGLPAGTDSLTVKATASDGSFAVSAAVSITVRPAPAVTITAPTGGQTFTAPAAVSVTASATPVSGTTISGYELLVNGVSKGKNATGSFSLSGLTDGAYSLVVKATDSDGIVGVSVPVTIRVNDPAAAAPTITRLDPASAQKGSGDRLLTINGTNFGPTSAVTFGGLALTVQGYSDTQLLVTVPASRLQSGGPVTVTVTNPPTSGGGGGEDSAMFQVIDPALQYRLQLSAGNLVSWVGNTSLFTVVVKNIGTSPQTLTAGIVTGVPYATLESALPTDPLQPGDSVYLTYQLAVPLGTVGGAPGSPVLIPLTLRVDAHGQYTQPFLLSLFQNPVTELLVTVLDDTTGGPISGALVSLDNSDHLYFTDGSGHVTLDAVAGSANVFAYAAHFLPGQASLSIGSGPSAPLTIRLQPGQALQVKSVDVTPITPQQAAADGVNLADPQNYNIYNFTVNLGAVSYVIPAVVIPRNPTPGTTQTGTVKPGPNICNLNPKSIPAGVNGFVVENITITGSGFQDGCKVQVNGSDMVIGDNGAAFAIPVTFHSSTEIVVAVPYSSLLYSVPPGYTLTVRNPDNSASNVAKFVVYSPLELPKLSIPRTFKAHVVDVAGSDPQLLVEVPVTNTGTSTAYNVLINHAPDSLQPAILYQVGSGFDIRQSDTTTPLGSTFTLTAGQTKTVHLLFPFHPDGHNVGLTLVAACDFHPGGDFVDNAPVEIDTPPFNTPQTGDEPSDCNSGDENSSTGGQVDIQYQITYPTNDPTQRIEEFIIVPGNVRILKQFWEATILIRNNSTLLIKKLAVTLGVPSGLTLPDLNGATQSNVQNLGDLPGQSSTQALYVVRGDRAGSYTLTGNANGDLQLGGSSVPLVSSLTSAPFQVVEPKVEISYHGAASTPQGVAGASFPVGYAAVGQPGQGNSSGGALYLAPFGNLGSLYYGSGNVGNTSVKAGQEFLLGLDVKNDSAIDLNGVSIEVKASNIKNAHLAPGQNAVLPLGTLKQGETAHVVYKIIPEVSGKLEDISTNVSATPQVSPVVNIQGVVLNAANDMAQTVAGTTVSIPVLANDSGSGALTVVSVTPGAHGSVTTDGATVAYTPGIGFDGTDSFSYTVQDADSHTATAFVSVTVAAPAASLTALSPASATAGSAGFKLTLQGTGFVIRSQAAWNGQNRATTFVSPTALTIVLSASDLALAGTVPVTVTNPRLSGFAAQTFVIANPAPVLTSLSPATAVANTPLMLTLTGNGFVPTSTVTISGGHTMTLTPASVTATQLTVAVPASAIAAIGSFAVSVTNPAPGGGTSAPQTLTTGLAALSVSGLTFQRAAGGNIQATVTVTNSGTIAVAGTILTQATLMTSGAPVGVRGLTLSLSGLLGPGTSGTATLTFPGTSALGNTAIRGVQVQGAYNGGTFGGSVRGHP